MCAVACLKQLPTMFMKDSPKGDLILRRVVSGFTSPDAGGEPLHLPVRQSPRRAELAADTSFLQPWIHSQCYVKSHTNALCPTKTPAWDSSSIRQIQGYGLKMIWVSVVHVTSRSPRANFFRRHIIRWKSFHNPTQSLYKCPSFPSHLMLRTLHPYNSIS